MLATKYRARFHSDDVLNILCTHRLLKHDTIQINNATINNLNLT